MLRPFHLSTLLLAVVFTSALTSIVVKVVWDEVDRAAGPVSCVRMWEIQRDRVEGLRNHLEGMALVAEQAASGEDEVPGEDLLWGFAWAEGSAATHRELMDVACRDPDNR